MKTTELEGRPLLNLRLTPVNNPNQYQLMQLEEAAVIDEHIKGVNGARSVQRTMFEEVADEAVMIRTFVNRNDKVCSLLGINDPLMLLLALGRVGREGRVFAVANRRDFKSRLFAGIAESLTDFTQVKGERTKSRMHNLQEVLKDQLLAPDELRAMRHTISAPFGCDVGFYLSGFSDPRVLRSLQDTFYKIYSLTPVAQSLPPLPNKIGSHSINVVFETDRFATVREDKKEELLWEIDRILKPGGKVLFREDGFGQVEIGHYGRDLWSRGYERWNAPRETHNNARWLIYRKAV